MSNKRRDLPNLWSEVIGAVSIALAIWAIVLVLAAKFLNIAALAAGISIASSVVVAGAAVYGIGSWRKQAQRRARHDIAHKAVEAMLEALERLALARSRYTDQMASFRSAQKSGEPWDRDDKKRLLEKIDEVDEALMHLRTAHQLVNIHLGDKASGAMKALVDLCREYTCATHSCSSSGEQEMSDDEFRRRERALRDWKDNSFTQELESARDRLLEELATYLLNR